ncbi:hypothetical protein BVY03_00855 [bacterium K02(2017)]|nr:hypothetical protein BVY03_00855 [bacterium K02(2017)]
MLLNFNILNSPFLFDTIYYINPNILNYFRWDIFNESRWVSNLSLAETYYLIQDQAFWYRLINLILHQLNSILLYLFLFKIFKATIPGKQNTELHLYAFAGAALFCLNPITTYATAYVIQRSILLATFFALLSLLSFIKSLKKMQSSWFVVTGILYYFSVHSKEHGIMLPVIYFILLYILNPPSLKTLKKLIWPFTFYILIAASIILKQKNIIGGVYEPLVHDVFNLNQSTNLPLAKAFEKMSPTELYLLSIMNQASLFFKYLLLMILPITSWMAISLSTHFDTNYYSICLILGSICFLLIPILGISSLKKSWRLKLFSLSLIIPWCFFFTEFSLVRFHESFVLYRSYIWMIGIYLIIPVLIYNLPKKSLIVIGTLIILSFFYYNRVQTFKSPLLAWADAAQKVSFDQDKTYPVSAYRIFSNLASYQSLNQNYTDAIKNYQQALKIYPQRYKANHSISDIYFRLKKYPLAFEYIHKVIKSNPEYPDAHYSLARLYAYTDKREQAIQSYLKALQLKPNYPQAHYNLANHYAENQNYNLAIKHYLSSLAISPHIKEVHYNLANTYFKNLDFKTAIKHYKLATQLDANYINAWHNMGSSYLRLGELELGKEAFKKALEINPNFELSRESLEKLPDSTFKP